MTIGHPGTDAEAAHAWRMRAERAEAQRDEFRKRLAEVCALVRCMEVITAPPVWLRSLSPHKAGLLALVVKGQPMHLDEDFPLSAGVSHSVPPKSATVAEVKP